jgi:protein-disulfide isomerase
VFCALSTTFLVVRREFSQSSTATAAEPEAIYLDGWEDALAAGIRAGSANAPVQVVEFADFQCPYCAHFEEIVRTTREKYAKQVAFTLVHYPLPQHSYAETAARAAECADMQGSFEAIRSLLFEKQQAFDSAPWMDFATQVGIPDIEEFDACVNDTGTMERVDRGKQLAQRFGVRGTPTIIVNGWKLPLPPSSEDFDKIVKNVADGRPPTEDIDFFSPMARN